MQAVFFQNDNLLLTITNIKRSNEKGLITVMGIQTIQFFISNLQREDKF